MRMVCISSSTDISVGLRLAGVQSFRMKNKDEIRKKLKELSKDSDVGIINITENIYKMAKEDFDEIIENNDLPLVVKIPNSKNI